MDGRAAQYRIHLAGQTRCPGYARSRTGPALCSPGSASLRTHLTSLSQVLARLAVTPIPSENPYWDQVGVTVCDSDAFGSFWWAKHGRDHALSTGPQARLLAAAAARLPGSAGDGGAGMSSADAKGHAVADRSSDDN